MMVGKGTVALHELTEMKYPNTKGAYSSNVSEYHENPSFWPIAGNFLLNLPDFCNLDRISPVYDGGEGDSGTSCVKRNENIRRQKEIIHPMCWNIKNIHYLAVFG